jgi:hypothetical protein
MRLGDGEHRRRDLRQPEAVRQVDRLPGEGVHRDRMEAPQCQQVRTCAPDRAAECVDLRVARRERGPGCDVLGP